MDPKRPEQSDKQTDLPRPPQENATGDKEQAHDVEQQRPPGPPSVEYPPMIKVIPILVAIYLAFFLLALDRTIIGTAIPQLSNDFQSFGDIGWYGSAYLLTSCAFQIIFGRIYTFYNPKWVYLTLIGLFEVGSAICGAAPNSTTFIFGRAIAGVGSAGVQAGSVVIFIHVMPLRKRPLFQGMLGAIFGIASVAGPLLGGVFTSDVSWRWCFYINLPIGAVTIIVLFFVLEIPKSAVRKAPTIPEQIKQLDPLGTAFFMPGIVCLLLALEWGGSSYAWSNARIIVLLILFVVLITGFIAVQAYKKEGMTIPTRIVKKRSIAAASWFAFCVGAVLLVASYYLPIWFQAIKAASAVRSGIMILPLILALVVGSILNGFFTNRVGYYNPGALLGSILIPIGAGLISTFTPTTPHPKWIGYQVLLGLGFGVGMQVPTLSAQAVLERHDVPTGVALMFFSQTLGSTVFISVSQNVLVNELVKGLRGVPGFAAAQVVSQGATELRQVTGPDDLGRVVGAYNSALVKVFYIMVAVSGIACFGALGLSWTSVKKEKVGKGGVSEGAGGGDLQTKPEKKVPA